MQSMPLTGLPPNMKCGPCGSSDLRLYPGHPFVLKCGQCGVKLYGMEPQLAWEQMSPRQKRLRLFVLAAVVLALIGLMISAVLLVRWSLAPLE